MFWNILDVLGWIFDILGFFSFKGEASSSRSDRKSLNYDEKVEKKVSKKSKYFTEKISAGFLVISLFFLITVFKDPLPVENYTQTLIVASLIGTGISFVVFFVMYVMELYYFKSLFKLLLFSCSVIAFFISGIMYIYFKSGLFLN